MMDLYIDDVRADISRNSFAVNWKWLDVTKILKRYTVASTNMRLPFSPVNNNIFAYSNIPGSDLTPIWNEKEAKIYFGNYLALTGWLKTKSIGVTDKNFQSSIKGTNGVIDMLNANTPREILTSHATANLPATWPSIQNALDNLVDGSSYGWMLPLIDDGTNMPSAPVTVNYHLTVGAVGSGYRTHELWLNTADFLTEMFSLASVNLKVFDGGVLNNFNASSIYSVMQDVYMPAYHIGIKRYQAGTLVNWDTIKDRYFNETDIQSIANADLSLLGGGTTWDVLKIISNYFNLGIYIDQQIDQAVLFDLNTTNTSVKDWTDKVVSITKSPVVKGYEKNNFIRYRPTDNLEENYSQIELTNNVNIEFLDEEKVIGNIDVGIPGLYNKTTLLNVFKLDYFNNKDVYKYPVFLNLANQEGVVTIQPFITDSLGSLSGTKALYKMEFLDTSSYYGWIEDNVLEYNEFYTCKIDINLSDLTDLMPWDTIIIKNMSNSLYINQMKSLNLNKPTTVELVKLG